VTDSPPRTRPSGSRGLLARFAFALLFALGLVFTSASTVEREREQVIESEGVEDSKSSVDASVQANTSRRASLGARPRPRAIRMPRPPRRFAPRGPAPPRRSWNRPRRSASADDDDDELG